MSLLFNIQYKSALASSVVNQKFHVLYGRNGIIEGFDVLPKSGMQVQLTPGKLIIQGTLITETSDTRTFTIPNNNTGKNVVYYIYAQYTHLSLQCIFSMTDDESVLQNPDIVEIASITVPNNATQILSENIKKGFVFRSYQELQQMIDEASDNLAHEITIVKESVKIERNITVNASGWVDDTNNSGYWIYDIVDENIDSDTMVDVSVHLSSLEDVANLEPVTQSFDGYFRLYATEQPQRNITIDIKKTRQVR